MIFVLAPMSLTGCALFSEPKLPAAPAYLTECAKAPTTEIAPGAKSRAETAALLARTRASELSKARCARDWSSHYEAIRGKDATP